MKKNLITMTECKALPLQSGDEEGSSTLSQLKTNKLVHSEEKKQTPSTYNDNNAYFHFVLFEQLSYTERERDRPTTVKTTIFLQKLV